MSSTLPRPKCRVVFATSRFKEENGFLGRALRKGKRKLQPCQVHNQQSRELTSHVDNSYLGTHLKLKIDWDQRVWCADFWDLKFAVRFSFRLQIQGLLQTISLWREDTRTL